MRRPTMERGSLDLRSGRWAWTIHDAPAGMAVLFHDERQPNNRMRAWIDGAGPTPDAVEFAARHPLLRWWEDPVGGVWEVRAEDADCPKATPEQRSKPRRRIIFAQPYRVRETELPNGRSLGELTSAEMTALLYEAE